MLVANPLCWFCRDTAQIFIWLKPKNTTLPKRLTNNNAGTESHKWVLPLAPLFFQKEE
jgi:hypothetical protein